MLENKNNLRKNGFTAMIFVGIFLLFSNTISAKSLERYKEDIQHLKADFAALISQETEEITEEEVFEEIPKLLPAEDKVEFNGLTVDVNNQWLMDEVKKYTENDDEIEKSIILTAIYERLDAIEFKIEELEASVERNSSKDDEKRKLNEILNREEYQKPAKEGESLLDRFLNWLDELLRRNAPERSPNLPASNFGGVAYFLQIVLYVLLALIVGFLIYKFAPFFIKKFRERERSTKNERVILGERIAADATSDNLFSEAEKLALQGNLRDAIRKGYIAFLFELSERKHIGLAKHKTNRDYLRSVRNNRELYQNMNGLTLNYERHWYGFQDAVEEDWEEFKTNYSAALSKES